MVAHWNDDDRDVSCVSALGLRNKLAQEQQQLGYLSNEVDLWKFLDVFESDSETEEDDAGSEDSLYVPDGETEPEPYIESESGDIGEEDEEDDDEDEAEDDSWNGHIMEDVAYKKFSYT